MASAAGWTPLKLLGAGASARVLLVRHAGALAALKLAAPGLEAARQLFAEEASRLAWARGTTLPELLEVGALEAALEFGGEHYPARTPYLLLSRAEGQRLSDWALAPSEALAWAVARDAGQALADLHATGLAHGDVKPDNIVVDATAAGIGCTLVDLGLGDEADAERPEGGSRRYLAPETFVPGATSSGRARDLYALGLCLLEASVPEARTAAAPQTLTARLGGQLRFVTEALLDPNAAARPNASWVVRQCPAEDLERDRRVRRRRVEREYLLLRRRELAPAERGHRVHSTLPGVAGTWLRRQAELLEGMSELRGASPERDTHTLHTSSEQQQRTWLVRLIGVNSLDFPTLPALGDDALAERLLALSEAFPLEALTAASLAAGVNPEVRSAAPLSPIEVALELGSESPSEAALARVEQAVALGERNALLELRAARALRRQHQLARALRLLTDATGVKARLEQTAILLRAGQVPTALEHLAAAEAEARDPDERGDCAAQRARIELARGRFDDAERALRGAPDTLAVLEARASLALSTGRLHEARAPLERALGQPHDAEKRARIEALFAHLAQREGDSGQALDRFRTAAEYAARAHAIVEEATYLIGVSSTASTLGRLDLALDAARRSELLFAYLGNPESAARAALASAAAYATADARLQAREAAERSLRFAREADDAHCRAFAHLILADVASASSAADHLEAAERCLPGPNDEDRLRIDARRLRLGQDVDVPALDLSSRQASVDVQLEWWLARAQAALEGRPSGAPGAILERLLHLSHERAAPDAFGPAMAYGAQLAAETGHGDSARKLVQAGTEAWRRLAAGTPPELALSLANKDWVKLVRAPLESQVTPGQVTDLAALIHGLSEREHLKPLCDRVLDALVLWTGVERGLLLLKAPGGRLVPRAARNVARRDLHPMQIELSRSLAERALESAECVVAADAQGELPELHHSVHALKLRSVMAVPLIARGETLGVVYLDDRVRRGAFGPRELAWVKLVAALASVAIADARDQLLLRRAARRASRAERRLAETLAERDAELDVAQRELATTRAGNRYAYPEIVGDSAALRQMLNLLDRVTPSEVPVLITGESGSGKELVARALATNGPRAKRPFVSENCSAIPETLLESTLFGHVRGAFTGASQNRIGLFQAADGGTLFLDEIADMSLGMQAKLLRALESGEIRRVGDERAIQVDVRVVAATHKNLSELTRTGRFREDLLYRLNVIRIDVPPLRERIDDIEPLVEYFLHKHTLVRGASSEAPPERVVLSRAALELLRGFAWPGNVRQLENETRRAMVLCDGEIRPEHLSPEVQLARPQQLHDGLDLRQHIDALEVRLVQRALTQTGGNQTRAAKLLGVSRFGLQKMMRRLDIDPGGPGGRGLS